MAQIVLGLETSCDETAVALVDSARRILAERLLSQVKEHTPFGGVVPEIAARAHLDHLDRLVGETMREAGLSYGDLAAVAATAGPGLIGGVIVGVTTAKAIALAHGLNFIGVNHLEGHALTARLTDDVAFPYLLLLVSGGHCQLLAVEGVGRYRRLGTTIDDAVGEAFDKTAKLLGLGFPGGPAVEQAALAGDENRIALPRPMLGRPGCDFSLAGLKTAVRLAAEKLGAASTQDIADLCASFQKAIGDVLADRCRNALAIFSQTHSGPARLVVAGGVAANKYLRRRLDDLARSAGAELIAPPPRLCTDNAAMIAWAGVERLQLKQFDALDLAPRPRWPLDPTATARIGRVGLGAGVKV
jgi:N6-L-threonylcarbamoyladenine synthase